MYERLDSGGRSGRTFKQHTLHSAVSQADADSVGKWFDHLRELPSTARVEILRNDLRIRTEWTVRLLAETIVNGVDRGNALQHELLLRMYRMLIELDEQLNQSVDGEDAERLLKETFIAFSLVDVVIACIDDDLQESLGGADGVNGEAE